ncbi:uncharacterized protein LOC128678311 isoform X4 [Plodia interpunctella]|uniref:uncharacterized protein LOC128678311 isoform X4 n=1 Tax=Plodia interpunctella TaxID=58824 RepID=UPI002367DFE5|nr:uncharacterized protein LOC128678311 isoform X4 [Plodia interpunctella]
MQLCLLNVILGFILLAVIDCNKPPTTGIANYCFKSETCTHSQKEKCGRNRRGMVKRFRDTCDMIKFNCAKRQVFTTVNMDQCKNVPYDDTVIKSEYRSLRKIITLRPALESQAV